MPTLPYKTKVLPCQETSMADAWAGIQAAVGKALAPRLAGQLEPHRYAHDRAMRIVRTLDRLAKAIPAELRPKRIDLVRIAALYACVGLTAPPRARTASADSAVDDAAELATDQLQSFLSAADIDLTLRILREHRLKETKLAEAQLLSDAISLEDVGLVGLWNQTRHFHALGRTLEQLIKLWKTQQEYGYWESRLRDGFHFEPARKVAAARLAEMEPIFNQLARQQAAEDVG